MDNFYISCNLPSFQSLETQNLDECVKPSHKFFDSESPNYSNECPTTTQLAYSGDLCNAGTDSQIMDFDPITSLFTCHSPTCK